MLHFSDLSRYLIQFLAKVPSFLADTIYRERGLISQFSGNNEEAKRYFRKGIEVYTPYPYPENRVGLAQLLLLESEKLPYWSVEANELAKEALENLEIARSNSASFDRFHIGTYIDALIINGKDDIAFPLLQEYLKENPDDERLNYIMAELLRKEEDYEEAEKYARKAYQGGAPKAPLTLANIIYSKTIVHFGNVKNHSNIEQSIKEALSFLDNFNPEFGHDQEVADGISAKIYRTIGKWEQAKNLMAKYTKTDNPYTIYEQAKIFQWEVDNLLAKKQYSSALNTVRSAIKLINNYSATYSVTPPLKEILTNFESLEDDIFKFIENI